MKRWTAFMASLLLLSLMAGCPFMSRVPLGEPGGHPCDQRLVGHWVATGGDEDSLQVTVIPFNEAEYYVEIRKGNDSPDRYRAFAFDVGGQSFLQINELSADRVSAEYCFARYASSGEHAWSLRFVGDKIVPEALATDPQALAAFLKEHLDDPGLDDEDTKLELRRAK